MISPAFIAHWRSGAPWATDPQVEDALIRSSALLELFSAPTLASAFAVRGGTALHTLVLPAPLRSSDNRDLVQVTPGPLGTVVTARRRRLDPRLGPSAFKRSPIPHSGIYEATQEFQKALKAKPRLAPVRYQLALAHPQAGTLQQVKTEPKEAVTIAPNFADAVLLFADLNIRSGAVQPAIEDLERLLARQPKAAAAHVWPRQDDPMDTQVAVGGEDVRVVARPRPPRPALHVAVAPCPPPHGAACPRVACPSRSQGGRLPRGRLAGYPGPTEPMGPEHGLLRWPPDGRPSTGGYTCAGPTVAHRLNGKRRGSGTADVSFRRGTWPTR